MATKKRIVMLGVAIDAPSGIASVVQVYRNCGLFERWPIEYIETMRPGGQLEKLSVAIGALTRFLILLVRRRVALVHIHLSSRASFWRKSIFAVLAFASKIPVLVHLHGSEFDKFYNEECGILGKRAVQFVFARAARVVVLSDQWAKFIEGISRSARVERIYNPAVLSNVAIDSSRRRDNVLVFLGRFGKRKGIFDLLDALVRLREEFPDIRLKCGGDGDVDAVSERIKRKDLAQTVKVLGWVTGEKKSELLSEGTVYVLPSYAEGLPMSILEAMAAGMPVVSTTVGGIPEAVRDGVEGFLISAGDVDALVNRVGRLLRDPGLRREFGAAAQRRVTETFGPNSVLPQLEALYEELGVRRLMAPD